MKKVILLIFFCFCSLSAFDEITSGKSFTFTKKEKIFIESHVVEVVIGTPWEPFGIKKREEFRGLSYDFFNLIKQKSGLRSTNSQVATFSDVLTSIKDKKSDISLSIGKTKDREAYALFSKSYATFPISIATSKDAHFIENIEFLKGKKIAVGKNFTAYKMMHEKYPHLKYVFVKDVEEGLRLLSQNRVFAFIDILPVLSYNINKFGYTNLKISGNTGINYDLSFMIRDDYPELLSISNKVIDSLSTSEKQVILNKWIAVVYDESYDYELLIELFALFMIILIIVAYKNRQLVKFQNVISEKNSALEKQKDKLLETNKLLQNTQKDLNISLDSFKTLVDATIEAILIIENGKITYCNEVFITIFAYDLKKSVYGTQVSNYFVEDIYNREFGQNGLELTGITSTKEEFPILVKKAYLQYESKNVMILSIFNLTELKNREKLILEQSKMASMGEMIGNIAHQWRQPLSTITTIASGLKLHKELGTFDDKLLDEGVEAIVKNGKFLSQTIDDFRDYLKDKKDKEEFDLTKLISQSLTLVRPTFKNNFIIDVMEINKPIFITSYFNELTQAIINILNNAKDALIESKEEDKYVFINFYIKNDEVVIEIHDNGGGIDENIIKNIYEPYFTTKHKSQGTGLGLYMTYKIITESLHGSIHAENILYRYNNKDYKGANFVIRLPLL